MTVIPWEVRNLHTNSRYLHALKRSLSLSDLQKRVLYGTLMGDGCLIPNASGNDYRLQIEQNARQKEYVFWKYEMFKNFVISPPRHIPSVNSWKFRTLTHRDFFLVRRKFYRNGKKILPNDLSFLVDPMALAVWFMDDGCYAHQKDGRPKGYILNTQNFTLAENERLREFLTCAFGLRTSLHRDKKYYRLYIGKNSMLNFQHLFDSKLQPSMLYKLWSSNPVET